MIQEIEKTKVVKLGDLDLDWLSHLPPDTDCFAYNHHGKAILELVNHGFNSENETHDLEISWEEVLEWFNSL